VTCDLRVTPACPLRCSRQAVIQAIAEDTDGGLGQTEVMPSRIRKSEIGQRAELYGAAYKLAWKQIPVLQKRERPDISLRVHVSIRRQLKAGAMDPIAIASEALKDVLDAKTRTRRTAQSSAS